MPAVKDQHEISVTFPMPSLLEHYAKKAEHYVAHLVGHEGAGSLLSALKVRCGATQMCVCVTSIGTEWYVCVCCR